MSAKNWTQGPWKIEPREAYADGSVYPATIVREENDQLVTPIETDYAARLAVSDPESHWATSLRRIANAHLITAAPELYEALDGLVHVFRDSGMYDEEVFEDALAALAKARGETP